MIGIERNHASRWWRLAKSSWFGFVVDGPEAESYRDAERFKMEGEEERRLGAGAEHHGRRAEIRREFAAATGMHESAEQGFNRVNGNFVQARGILQEIERREGPS